MKAQHKAISIDYSDWSQYDQTPDALRMLSDADIAALCALTEYLRWSTRWQNSPTRQDLTDYVDGLVKRLLEPVQAGTMFELRQSPDNPCLLEQTLDGGQTWTPAFDYSLCQIQTQLDTINWQQLLDNIQAINDEWQTAWDGTPQSIHTSAPNVVPADNNACAAALQWVETMLYYAINTRRIALGLVSLAAGGLGLLLGIPGAILGGVVVSILGVDLAALEAAVADRSAVEQMACKLRTALQGDTLSWSGFKADMASLATTGDNEATIKAVMVAFADMQENYWHYLNLLGTAVDLSAGGYAVNCPCDGWCYEWPLNGLGGMNGWTPAYFQGYANPAAIYVDGYGFRSSRLEYGTSFGEVIMVKRTMPFVVSANQIRVKLSKGMRGTGGYPALLVDTVTAPRLGLFNWQRYVTGGSNATIWTFATSEPITFNALTLAVSTDRAGTTGYYPIADDCYVEAIQLRGYGVNPFGENNCTGW